MAGGLIGPRRAACGSPFPFTECRERAPFPRVTVRGSTAPDGAVVLPGLNPRLWGIYVLTDEDKQGSPQRPESPGSPPSPVNVASGAFRCLRPLTRRTLAPADGRLSNGEIRRLRQFRLPLCGLPESPTSTGHRCRRGVAPQQLSYYYRPAWRRPDVECPAFPSPLIPPGDDGGKIDLDSRLPPLHSSRTHAPFAPRTSDFETGPDRV